MSNFVKSGVKLRNGSVTMETVEYLGNSPIAATKKNIFRFSRKFYLRNNSPDIWP